MVYAISTNGGIHVFVTLGLADSYNLQANTYFQILIPPIVYFSLRSVVKNLKKREAKKVKQE
jgi:hypothetical protein